MQRDIADQKREENPTEEGRWHRVATVEQLEAKGRIVAKIEDKQLAIFQTKAGMFAINNRCPHEGYPLSEGSLVNDCTLSCNWHGWTFNLDSGQAIQGRDAVRTYPVMIQKDAVFVDLTPPDPAAKRRESLEEFWESFEEHDYSRMARSLCRYTMAGGDYRTVAAAVVEKSAGMFERGIGHPHAGLADWIDLAEDDEDLQLVGFLEAFGHFSWDGLFSPEAEMPRESRAWSETAMLDALETMDQEAALKLVRGAFDAGLGFNDLKPLFLKLIFDHYAGFGHPAIYVMKSEQLIEQLGQGVELTLCLQLARYLCLAAREDLIPEFRDFGETLKAAPESRAGLPDADELSGQSVRQLLAVVGHGADSDHQAWETLLAASAINMLRFDDQLQFRIEQPIAQNIGWLDFTHAITFAEAARLHAVEDTLLWRSVHLQQACFIGRNAKFLGDDQRLQFHIVDEEHYLAEQKAALFNMDVGEYIYAVHRLKMVVAVDNLRQHVSAETASLLTAALNKYLSAHVQQRAPARTAYQARATVLRE